MKQPIKKIIKKANPELTKKKYARKQEGGHFVKRHKQEYGTSKLEERFAKNFLDKLGVKYVYQYKAESIGRYFDFYLPIENILIEIDGTYWHSKGLVYEEMNPTQKKNKRVDKLKDHWALVNGIPLIRIWEDDINKHQEKVMKMLRERLYLHGENKKKKDNMNKRH